MALGHRLSRRALFALAVLARGEKRVLVVAHRGHHAKLPENSLAAYESAIRLGCDFIEVDCRPNSAGVLVSAHDAPAGTGAPPMVEVLRLARGRIGVYFDWKQGEASQVAALLRETGTLEQALVYAHPERLRALRAAEPRVRVLPELMAAEWVERQLEWFRPEMAAFSGKAPDPTILARARAAGVKVLVDALGRNDQPDFWRRAINAGAAGLQTDRPEELIAWLRLPGA